MNPVLRCSVFRWLLYSDRDCINDLVKIRARPLHPVSRECFEAGSRSVRDWCLHCPGSRDWLWSLENIFETSPSLEGRARWSPRNHDSFGSRLYPWKSLEVNLFRLCGKYVRNFVIFFLKCTKGEYSGCWKTKFILNFNGNPLFGFPMACSFPMVFCFEQSGCHFVQNHQKSEQNGHHFVWIYMEAALRGPTGNL